MTKLRIAGLLGVIGLLLLAGCSSPLGDDGDATTTPTAETPMPDPTDSPVAAVTNIPSKATPTSPMEPTETPSDDGTPPATASSPTATSEPLPTGGAEMLIDGAPITRVFQGSETGRTIYAVAGGELWRSNDGGRDWSAAGEGDIGELVVAMNEQNVLYSGDAGGCGRGFSFFDFRRSTDAGRSWGVVDANKDIEPLLAYETSDGAIVYGTNCGLSVSADGGTTWERVADLNGEQIFVAVTERNDPMSQVLVVGATEGGTGRLFLLDTAQPARPMFDGALTQFWGDAVVDWIDGRIVIANAHRVGVSDDGGETWTWTRDGLENATYSVDPLFEPIPENELDPFRKFDAVRIDPTNRDRIWLGGTHGAYQSVDGGQTWDSVGGDVPITGIAISTLTDRIMISSDSGTRLWALDES